MKKKKAPFVLSVAFVVAMTTTAQPLNESTAKAETLDKHEVTNNDNPDREYVSSYIVSNKTVLEESPECLTVIESKQGRAVLPYIKKAEQSRSGEDVYLAQLLIEKTPEKEREVLRKRLNLIIPTSLMNEPKEIERAKKEVLLAEQNIKNEQQLKIAQEQVVSLKMSEEKMSLIERLNAIYQILIKEKEQKREQSLKSKVK